MLYMEIMVICFSNLVEQINTLCQKNAKLLVLTFILYILL